MKSKLLTIYLPQFHRIPENDKWWGEGFTEWTNVKRGKPLYHRHYQPREPLNDNYYDLSNLSVLEEHTRLARKSGIDGFCFYHYYFNGKKLLEKPIENYRNNSKEYFPYCLIWANQTWSRTWYRTKIGSRILLKQEYGNKEDWIKHFYYLLDFFNDERYIKIDEKPIYIIYLPQDIPCRKVMFSLWNKLAKENGFKGLYLIAMDTFAPNDTKEDLYDAYMNFEPLHALKNDKSYRKKLFLLKEKLLNITNYHSNKWIKRLLLRDMYTYSFLSRRIYYLTKKNPEKKTFIGVFSGWDNTSRKDEEGWIARGSTPKKFGRNLRTAIKRSEERGNEFVFINAWNEWSEGAYIEPDKKYGYAYLNEVKKAVAHFEKTYDLDKEPVLLMTASILPQEKRYIKLKNPEQRLKQYIDSLKYYIEDTEFKKIVLCENSGYDFPKQDIELLAKKNNKRIEILQFYGNEKKIKKYGKGYGEGEIINYALKNSRLINESDFFIKVTGRLKIKNMNKIKSKLKLNRVYMNKSLIDKNMMDTVIYGMPKKIYSKIFEYAYEKVNDKKNIYIEHIFNHLVMEKDLKIYNLPYFPDVCGVCGTNGLLYQKNIGIKRTFYNLISQLYLFNNNWIRNIL